MSSESEKQWQDPDWLYEQYHEKGRSMNEIADIAEVVQNTVKHWMDKHEIPRRSISEANAKGNIAKLHDKDWLKREYVEKGRSGCEIAEELGIDNNPVYKWLDKHGLESRTRSEARSDGDVVKLHDERWLRREYVEKERTGPDIAEECGVYPDTVYAWLERHDIQIREMGHSRSDGDWKRLQDDEWLRTQYEEQNRSTRDIGSELDLGSNTVLRRLREIGCDIRPAPVDHYDTDYSKLTPEYIREQHHKNNVSIPDLADEIRCDHGTLYRKMAEWGIDRRGHEFGHPAGTEHPQYKENAAGAYFGPNWDEQKLKARIRDHAQCQVCGKTDAEHIEEWGRVNHVHHIIPRAEFIEDGVLDYEQANKLENLITLCSRHHKRLEGVPIDNGC